MLSIIKQGEQGNGIRSYWSEVWGGQRRPFERSLELKDSKEQSIGRSGRRVSRQHKSKHKDSESRSQLEILKN